MMPGGQCEPLFLCSLEILSSYEAIMAAFPDSCSPLESDNTRHFFSTITDNLLNQEMKAVLQQKIAQLVSSAAWHSNGHLKTQADVPEQVQQWATLGSAVKTKPSPTLKCLSE